MCPFQSLSSQLRVENCRGKGSSNIRAVLYHISSQVQLFTLFPPFARVCLRIPTPSSLEKFLSLATPPHPSFSLGHLIWQAGSQGALLLSMAGRRNGSIHPAL